MKGIWKLAGLFGLNVVLALMAAPQQAEARDICSGCWTATCSYGTGHAFFSLVCEDGSNAAFNGNFWNPHVGAIEGTCIEHHTYCG